MTAKRAKWSEAQEQLLAQRYPHEPTSALAIELGLTPAQVYRKASHMGLLKSDAFLATSSSGRMLPGGKLGQASQFKPGQAPWNKGQHFDPGGRSAETRFKPGDKPHTWQPIGSLRLTKDGYLQIKLTDIGYPPRDWVAYHRHVWEQVHGPLPPGHIVVFRPGRKTTDTSQITVDAIECISRAENMRRNTVHNLPKELAEIIQLQGALRRQINKRTTPK